MRDGFLSETLAAGGFYLIAKDQVIFGTICIVSGIFGGALRFFHKSSKQDLRENRSSEIFEISKAVLAGLLHATNDSTSEDFKKNKTVH